MRIDISRRTCNRGHDEEGLCRGEDVCRDDDPKKDVYEEYLKGRTWGR